MPYTHMNDCTQLVILRDEISKSHICHYFCFLNETISTKCQVIPYEICESFKFIVCCETTVILFDDTFPTA
jgi:hypothetical protein